MYYETKRAIKKAFEIGRLLFSMGKENYNRLLHYTSKIQYPTKEEVEMLNKNIPIEEAAIEVLKDRYKHAAKAAGFDEEYGMAMLQYVALLEAMRE